MLCHLLLVLVADPRALSPDGKTEATAKDKAISVAEVASGKLLMKMAGHKDDIVVLAFSPDGKILASGDKGGDVRHYDAPTGKEIRRFVVKGAPTGIVFSNDGKTFSILQDKMAKKFDLATGKEIK